MAGAKGFEGENAQSSYPRKKAKGRKTKEKIEKREITKDHKNTLIHFKMSLGRHRSSLKALDLYDLYFFVGGAMFL